MSDALQPLLLDGVIDQVIGQLKAGKEAEVWLVEHAGQVVAAKVYKERHTRSFKNNAGYTEGRQVRSSRTQRAIDKGSKFGQAAAEEAWKAAEADALYKLHAQGVRVPTPVMFYEGVLLMELVLGPDGAPAPRLVDAPPADADDARAQYLDLRQHIIGMLSVDLIHGDLSPYNILASARGPVIIDFPQTIAAARNNRAESYFARDLENVRQFFLRYDPRLNEYAGDAADIWSAYLRRDLSPDYVPSGRRADRRATPPAPSRAGAEQGARGSADRPQGGGHVGRGGSQGAPAPHPGRGSAHGAPPPHAARPHGGAHPVPAPHAARANHAPRAAAPPMDPAEAELLALQEQILKQGGGERGRPFAAPEVQAHRGGKRRGGFRPGPPGGGRSGPQQHARPAHHGGGQPSHPNANRAGGARPAQSGAARSPQHGGARPAQGAAHGSRSPHAAGTGQPRHGGTRAEQHGGSHHESHGGERQHRPQQGGRGTAPGHGSRSTPQAGGRPPPAQGGAPTTAHGGNRPTTANGGNRPTTANAGDRPATAHGGDRPAAAHGGNRPAGAHGSDRPAGAHGAGRAAAAHGAGRPASAHGAGRPAATHGAGRPAVTHGGASTPAVSHRPSPPGGSAASRSTSGPRRNGASAGPVVVKGHVRPPGASRP